MPLLDLKTNLKDLKFGNDERGGGNSGQPYVVTRIPATNEALQTGFSGVTLPLLGAGAGAAVGALGGSIIGASGTGAIVGLAAGLGIGLIAGSQQENPFRIPTSGTGGPDFLIRGGTLLPNIIVNDEIRLAKFFASTEGLLFTVKQNLLSRLAVKTQTSPKLLNDGVYTPLSSLIEAAGLPFGLHVNKQDLNPLADTGVDSTNERLYGVKVTPKQPQLENRLVRLYGKKIIYNYTQNIDELNKNIIPGNDDISSDPLTLLSYGGGPNAPLGIGLTKIRYNNPTFYLNEYQQIINSNYITFDSYRLNTNATKEYRNPLEEEYQDPTFIGPPQLIRGEEIIESTFDENNFRNVKGYIPSQYQRDFRLNLRRTISDIKENNPQFPVTIMGLKSPSYLPGVGYIIEERTNLGDPGNASGKDISSYTNGVYKGAASENSYDKINAVALYKSSSASPSLNDLINFRIGVLDNDKPGGDKVYIHFRAFLDQISDNYTSTWDPIRYLGRGENFYTYRGFDRKVSLSWTVAAQSKIELMPMYRRLNYLASLCAPDYSSTGYMRGNIVTLTIGGYFYEQPGIITGLTYEMNDENSTWEIGLNDDEYSNIDPSVKQLPHLIKVRGFEFIPIHNFVPRKQVNTYRFNPEYISEGSDSIEPLYINDRNNIYGQERFISLNDVSLTSSYEVKGLI